VIIPGWKNVDILLPRFGGKAAISGDIVGEATIATDDARHPQQVSLCLPVIAEHSCRQSCVSQYPYPDLAKRDWESTVSFDLAHRIYVAVFLLRLTKVSAHRGLVAGWDGAGP
jgi:hypothetical protein